VFFLSLFLNGCVHKIQLSHVETGQVIQGQYNTFTRGVGVAMPDGEVLTCGYSAIENASFSFGTATAFSGLSSATGMGYGITSGGRGQAYSLLKSETSSLMMELIVSYSEWTGHGFGEARTNDDRIYKIQF